MQISNSSSKGMNFPNLAPLSSLGGAFCVLHLNGLTDIGCNPLARMTRIEAERVTGDFSDPAVDSSRTCAKPLYDSR